jgi:hypothetical protein
MTTSKYRGPHSSVTLVKRGAGGKKLTPKETNLLSRILGKDAGWTCTCLCGCEVIFDHTNIEIGYATCPRCFTKLQGIMKRAFDDWLKGEKAMRKRLDEYRARQK